MRDPALHITRSSLITVLASVGIVVTVTQATDIIRKAKRYQIRDRHILEGTTRQRNKSERLIVAEKDHPDVDVFQRMLMSHRQILGHKAVLIINKNDRTYVILKEIAQAAHQFTTTFNLLPIENGYKKFIDIGFDILGRKYNIHRLKAVTERIFQHYENMDIVQNDENYTGTSQFYECWKACMVNYANVHKELDTSEMVNMVYGRQEAEGVDADLVEWIVAQFEGLMWLNAIPELSQFYGDGAIQRYNKYVTKLQKPVEEDNLPTQYEDEAEAEYYKKLRNQKLR